MEFLWRIFPLLRANRLYAIFNTGLKTMASSIRNIFMSSSTRSTGFGSVCHEPCPTTDFLIFYFRWREGVPTSVLGSQPIVWLLPSSFRCQATRVRLPSTNICWSPRDPHSFLTVILWRLATVNSNTGNSINLISIVSVGDNVTLPTSVCVCICVCPATLLLLRILAGHLVSTYRAVMWLSADLLVFLLGTKKLRYLYTWAK